MKLSKLIASVILTLCVIGLNAQSIIPIETKDFAMVFQTDSQNRLWNVYFGNKLTSKDEYRKIENQYYFPSSNAGISNSAYTPSGTWNLTEPALQIKHSDGNLSTELHFVDTEVEKNTNS